MEAEAAAFGKMFVAVDTYADERIAADFTHTPMTVVDNKAAGASTQIKQAISDLGGKAAIQAANAYGQETDVKNVLVQTVEDEMRLYNKTAASISDERQDPTIMDRFRLPHGNSATQVKAKANSFGDAITELGLEAEFEAHGHGATPAAAIKTMAGNVQTGQGQQATALSKQVGAGVGITGACKNGKGAVKTFDAMFSVKYKGDAEQLAAWTSVKHVRKTDGGKGSGGSSTNPPSPTPPGPPHA